jgi:hypothetical protein
MDLNSAVPQGSAALKSRSTLILAVFVASVFTSALLLFAVQPMFARMVLPRLGGSPSVWSVAMVFFQAMLLGGYAYAHYLMRATRPRYAAGIHLALLFVAGLLLPLSIVEGWGDPPSEWAALWLLGLFTVSIGVPFFALSANNPMLQAWFVRTGHRDGRDPYFLYAASNVGSFLALLSYPVLVEPALTVRDQNLWWSGGFWLLFALIAWCAYFLLRSPRSGDAPVRSASEPVAPLAWAALGRWVFLSAIPSGLLIAVTAHISTDVAAAPLLWVVPLALYLLTWVLVFQRRPLIPHAWILVLQPFAILGLVALLAFGTESNLTLTLAGHLIAFFIIAMAAHGELARQRPPPEHLTAFYLALSFGGMVGGLFAGLTAPYAFSWVAEYPILIVLAALCLPFLHITWGKWDRLFWIAAVLIAVAALAPYILGWKLTDAMARPFLIFIICIVALSILFVRNPFKFAFAVALALAMLRLYPIDEGRTETVRSFFGVHKIYETSDGKFRVLMHGTTVHGAQRLKTDDGKPVDGRPEVLSYYHDRSPMAQVIEALRKRKDGPLRVAVVGLGTGTLTCHIQPGETWRFFEIDPSIVAIARDPRRFSFISECAPEVPIVIGDARLTLTREPDHSFDLIIVDAYTSDAIPIHLATKEAMAIYKSKLTPNGVVMMHISNRHLELASVITGIAAANGLKTWVYDRSDNVGDEDYVFTSEVAISAADAADIGELALDEHWQLREPDPAQRVWTDDYSNIVGAILRKP